MDRLLNKYYCSYTFTLIFHKVLKVQTNSANLVTNSIRESDCINGVTGLTVVLCKKHVCIRLFFCRWAKIQSGHVNTVTIRPSYFVDADHKPFSPFLLWVVITNCSRGKMFSSRDQVPFSGDPLHTVPLQFPLQLSNKNLSCSTWMSPWGNSLMGVNFVRGITNPGFVCKHQNVSISFRGSHFSGSCYFENF